MTAITKTKFYYKITKNIKNFFTTLKQYRPILSVYNSKPTHRRPNVSPPLQRYEATLASLTRPVVDFSSGEKTFTPKQKNQHKNMFYNIK